MTRGECLRKLREAQGVSLSQAARECGISKSYLWNLEQGGHPGLSLATAVWLMDYYGGNIKIFSQLPVTPPHEATR